MPQTKKHFHISQIVEEIEAALPNNSTNCGRSSVSTVGCPVTMGAGTQTPAALLLPTCTAWRGWEGNCKLPSTSSSKSPRRRPASQGSTWTVCARPSNLQVCSPILTALTAYLTSCIPPNLLQASRRRGPRRFPRRAGHETFPGTRRPSPCPRWPQMPSAYAGMPTPSLAQVDSSSGALPAPSQPVLYLCFLLVVHTQCQILIQTLFQKNFLEIKF